MNKLTVKDREELQVLIHYVGREQFLKDLIQVLYNASDDVEDIDQEESEKYRETATKVLNIIEE